MQPPKRQFGPTQKDIAAALDLSQSAVTLALGDRPHKLPPETVARIRAKAEEIGYRPQRMARILRNGRSHTIGILFQSGPYHAPQERVKNLAQGAIKAGYQLIAVDLDWFSNDAWAAQDYLLGAAVEGVILCNLLLEPPEGWLEVFRTRSIPVLALASSVPPGMNEAVVDIKQGVQQMTEHHLAQGARDLVLLLPYRDARYSGPLGKSIAERVGGFTAALGGAVFAPEESAARLLGFSTSLQSSATGVAGRIIYPTKTREIQDVFDLGRLEMQRLLRDKSFPHSVVCANDEIAAGALSTCIQRKIAVPETVLISGVDDAPFSRSCGIPLSTISHPSRDITRWAISRIVELIENPVLREEPQIRRFQCKLILRQSTQRQSTSANSPREG